ncbi:MAG: hypothetical protein GWN58_57970, partial [Anaerolineae bacterium]|nr:hypothetical protein [Anaerolineae bacterium]
QRILTHNRTYLESLLSQTPDRLLLEGGWIKRQVLNSIPPEHRLEKFAQILHRRQREHPSEAITSALAVIAAHRLQDRCQQLL